MKKKRKKKRLHTIAYIVSVLIALGVGYFAFRYGRYHSGNALLSQARDEAASGEYQKAAQTVDRIINLRDSRVRVSVQELLLMKADYLYHAADFSGAADTALELISSTSSDSDLAKQAAEIAVNAYKNTQNYQELADFLHDYKDSSLADTYAQYCCEAPDINLKSGTYEEKTKITLEGGHGGTVYYTTDGSDPTEESRAYKNSFVLKKGDYDVRAVYVNSYGVISRVTQRDITITSKKPDAPTVTPKSGIYTSGEKITAQTDEEDCEIYYTDDGSEPDTGSEHYTGPIDMPSGSTTYCFVTVTQDGIVSDEVTRTYNLRSRSVPDASEGGNLIRDELSSLALSQVKKDLASGKTIADITGRSESGDKEKKSDKNKKKSEPTQEEILQASYVYYNPGLYFYSYVTELSLDSRTYYLYEEKYVGSSGRSVTSQNMYAVNISSSEVFRAESSGALWRISRIDESDILSYSDDDPDDYAGTDAGS